MIRYAYMHGLLQLFNTTLHFVILYVQYLPFPDMQA